MNQVNESKMQDSQTTIPDGYKQTEVGIIPDDWDVKPIGDILQNSRLGGNYPNQDIESSHPLIKMGNVGRGFIDLDKVEYIANYFKPSEKDKLKFGDVLFNTRNTLDLVGKVAIWRNELPLAFYNSNLLRLEFNPKHVSSNFFINYIFNTNQSLAQLKGFATGTTSVAAIYTRDLLKFKIPLPPLPEQRAIAEVLSDVDALITSLDRLVAKKRNIKQGAMQLLLTGKKRLAGFSGEWETKTLGEVATLHRDNINPASFPDRLFVHFSLPAFDSGQKPVIEFGKTIGSNKFKVPSNAILLSKLNPRIPRIWAPSDIPDEALASTEFLILKPKESVSRSFLYTICSSPSFCEQMELSATGTTGSHQRISPTDALMLKFPLPENPAEQKAIAQILSDMDAEIEALEKKREKYKTIKQGMMQELLTGKTRLV